MGFFLKMQSLFTVLILSVKTMSWSKMVKLGKLILPHPLFFIMALYATRKTWKIIRKKYPDTHGKDGLGNAFRHALWTGLLASYNSKISSPKKAVAFTQNLTDLYEDLFPNAPLAKAMDLQNNRVGLEIYQNLIRTVHRQFIETSFVAEAVEKKLPTARKIKNPLEAAGSELVYLKEE